MSIFVALEKISVRFAFGPQKNRTGLLRTVLDGLVLGSTILQNRTTVQFSVLVQDPLNRTEPDHGSTRSKDISTRLGQSPTRTSSGRQRRPTEKENYRISEVQHVEQRHEQKKQRTNQRTVKALRTVFKHHPEVFDNEPAELHSDADVEEDTMFTDRNVHSKLSFSTGKIPPTLTPVSRHTSSARKSLSNSLVKGYKGSSSSLTAVSSGEASMSDGSPTHPGRHPTFHNSDDEWADDLDADEDDSEDR
ncbi:uncharacterized protein F5147DRAFT_798195 [Suillus discolor]|uniref:Uncharacterized protein n=1 Tax=Suillus discolor TaxID=1912936 RepID=A0A9P7EQG3_9AGAM|nr:uncharacterized protein F5147DRAFT_798195 [Suillus discolor]KAG2084118.1 hypothetical protein F5147DRAFT_798195 [Suillus discolor]